MIFRNESRYSSMVNSKLLKEYVNIVLSEFGKIEDKNIIGILSNSMLDGKSDDPNVYRVNLETIVVYSIADDKNNHKAFVASIGSFVEFDKYELVTPSIIENILYNYASHTKYLLDEAIILATASKSAYILNIHEDDEERNDYVIEVVETYLKSEEAVYEFYEKNSGVKNPYVSTFCKNIIRSKEPLKIMLNLILSNNANFHRSYAIN